MNPTPTGGSATPSRDGADPEAPEGGDPAASVPGPRVEADLLPRRTRVPRDTGTEPGAEPGPDPEGRPYTPADPETLDRLLSGLREI